MKINNLILGAAHSPVIIAEMSGNHNQSIDRALAIVDAAASSGADMIKLQTYTADTITLDLHDNEFFISLSGIVTFKNAVNVQEVAAKVPLENMLIETDAPYLTPVPFRGKPNRPAHVKYVAQKIAEIKGVTVEEVETITTKNSCDLFSIN